MSIIIKQRLRTEQDTRFLCGALRHSHHVHGTRRREDHAGADSSVQRGRSGSWQGARTEPTSDLGLGED